MKLLILKKESATSIVTLCSATLNLCIHILGSSCFFDCLFVSKNVKTAEPIGPKFLLVPYEIPGVVYGWLGLKTFV